MMLRILNWIVLRIVPVPILERISLRRNSREVLIAVTNEMIEGLVAFQYRGFDLGRNFSPHEWFDWSLIHVASAISQIEASYYCRTPKEIHSLWIEYKTKFEQPRGKRDAEWVDPLAIVNEWEWNKELFAMVGEQPPPRGSDLLIDYLRKFQELSLKR